MQRCKFGYIWILVGEAGVLPVRAVGFWYDLLACDVLFDEVGLHSFNHRVHLFGILCFRRLVIWVGCNQKFCFFVRS